MPDDGRRESADLTDYEVRDASDTLNGPPGDDPLDQGVVTPDRWSAGIRRGLAAADAESLDEQLAEEEPDVVFDRDAGQAGDFGGDENATEEDIARLRHAQGPNRRAGLPWPKPKDLSKTTRSRWPPVTTFSRGRPQVVISAGLSEAWRLLGGQTPPRLDAEAQHAWSQPGWIKVATEFRFEPIPAGTLLSTETRILATDPGTRRSFAAEAVLPLVRDGGRLCSLTSDAPAEERGIASTNLYVRPAAQLAQLVKQVKQVSEGTLQLTPEVHPLREGLAAFTRVATGRASGRKLLIIP